MQGPTGYRYRNPSGGSLYLTLLDPRQDPNTYNDTYTHLYLVGLNIPDTGVRVHRLYDETLPPSGLQRYTESILGMT